MPEDARADKTAAVAARNILAQLATADPVVIADALEALWRPDAPPAPLLTADQKELASQLGIEPAFRSAGVPVLSAIGEQVGLRGQSDVPRYLPLARLLWHDYGREGRVVAAWALGPMELEAPDAVVPVILGLATSCNSWEECDHLAMRALEPVLRRDPDTWLEPLGRLVSAENKWVRRAALIALGRLPLVHSDRTARCVELLRPALGDRDTDVKRALSFALRLCARGDLAAVKRFLLDERQASDADSLWVLCDVVRSMARALLPEFVDLLPVYRAWLESGAPQARKSVEAAIRALETA